MVSSVIMPFRTSGAGFTTQPDVEPPAPVEGASIDLLAGFLPVGLAGARWGSPGSQFTATFTSNRPVVMEEGGKRFVRLNSGGVYSGLGATAVPNGSAFTRFARVRFPEAVSNISITSVYGSGTPNVYIGSVEGEARVLAHNGAPLTHTTPIVSGVWYSIIVKFDGSASVINVNGTEVVGNTGTGASKENGFTVGFRAGTGYPQTVMDVARAGQVGRSLDATERALLLTQLNEV